MKLYTEEQMKKAIRFGFESSSILDEGVSFIETQDYINVKPAGSRYDHRLGKDVILYEGIKEGGCDAV